MAITMSATAIAAAGCGSDAADQVQGETRQAADSQPPREQLREAQRRVDELSEQAEKQADGKDPELAAALRDVNQRLSDAAAGLRDADDAADVREVLEQQIGPASDRLSSALDAQQQGNPDTRRQLEQARDKLEHLRDDLPDLGG